MSESDAVNASRRRFVATTAAAVGAVMGAAVGVPALGYLASPALEAGGSDAWVPLGNLESFSTQQPTPFSFTRSKTSGWRKSTRSYTVYVIRNADGVRVLSSRCTHLSCRVTWHEEQNAFTCPCHDAQFGPQGEVLYGPPPKPLEEYETKIEDGALLIRVVEA